ncbi:BsuBI/PstI family type II restriction endonuclease [Rhodococcus tibetensis]|uniref:Restriction endonuclease n=1 Tax=Rhodococcus tibetensis TaxID=2965064 RepID=A0ABT1QHL9_9NOCA|nr:BsuBI/PstI family type II restriction endonuclease [Rhodococcus sp. FXJ9.536]MCQ4120597.1 restriction endonuclease [Rhodococcus sp. FXJ9.536]
MITNSAELKVREAQQILRAFGFDAQRSNERSAWVLLGLLQLKPNDSWSGVHPLQLGVTDLMEFIAAHYRDTPYKANTRETIRRQTLHQFVDALFVELNPDDSTRAVNSPKTVYTLHADALAVIKRYGCEGFDSALARYLSKVPGLKAQYAAAREMNRIPVTLPSGDLVLLSPGGQNTLIKAMIADFCSYYTPGGHVLYVGDADSKMMTFDEAALASLGVTVDHHGKMPDLIVYLPEKNWLVLLEAATTHGPVDAKRHQELATLFKGSTAGLVYVSCFPDRATMRKYLAEISWETEVWCASDPTHLIHFNGERFLGPYGEAAGLT